MAFAAPQQRVYSEGFRKKKEKKSVFRRLDQIFKWVLARPSRACNMGRYKLLAILGGGIQYGPGPSIAKAGSRSFALPPTRHHGGSLTGGVPAANRARFGSLDVHLFLCVEDDASPHPTDPSVTRTAFRLQRSSKSCLRS